MHEIVSSRRKGGKRLENMWIPISQKSKERQNLLWEKWHQFSYRASYLLKRSEGYGHISVIQLIKHCSGAFSCLVRVTACTQVFVVSPVVLCFFVQIFSLLGVICCICHWLIWFLSRYLELCKNNGKTSVFVFYFPERSLRFGLVNHAIANILMWHSQKFHPLQELVRMVRIIQDLTI